MQRTGEHGSEQEKQKLPALCSVVAAVRKKIALPRSTHNRWVFWYSFRQPNQNQKALNTPIDSYIEGVVDIICGQPVNLSLLVTSCTWFLFAEYSRHQTDTEN